MARCALCDRLATDPGRGQSAWKRAVVDDRQVLICPTCQRDRPAWSEGATACPVCGSKRLHKVLGDHVCRDCGRQWSSGPEDFSP